MRMIHAGKTFAGIYPFKISPKVGYVGYAENGDDSIIRKDKKVLTTGSRRLMILKETTTIHY
jgi:hypothetical protein